MKKILFGNEIERMPDPVFRFMKVLFSVYYFFKPAGRYISGFGIRKGDTVVDYGCGTGAFLRDASEMTGPDGHVYAVDVHELAIESTLKIIRKYGLKNITPVLSDGRSSSIPDETADLVFAIDMFHMVKDQVQMLRELRRIIKSNGTLILEDGHQPRSRTMGKIGESGCWSIVSEHKRYIRCTPKTQEEG